MRVVDRLLQRWRAHVARAWIPAGACILDVGCHQGEFLKGLCGYCGPSVGLDPLAPPEEGPNYRLLAQSFVPPTPFAAASFDVVVLLATLEHIRAKDALAGECFRLLRAGGRVVATVPSPAVDALVVALHRLRLADGMSLEEHHGFDPRRTSGIFRRHGFVLEHRRRFQLGFNHLFVFRKPHAATPRTR